MAVTLKDIAAALNVTTTTVHRAIRNKPGVSEEMRTLILETAAKMGYQTNYMAASLKRRDPRLAVVLPEPTDDNRYYYSALWAGVKNFLAEVSEFGVIIIEMSYRLEVGANGNALKRLYEQHSDNLAGVLTIADEDDLSSFFTAKLAEKNIPIVYVGADIHKQKRFCCVRSKDEMAGALAAELLTAFRADCDTRKKIIVTGHFGQLGLSDQRYNIQGSEKYIARYAPAIEIIKIGGADPLIVSRQVTEAISADDKIFGVYAASARFTVHLAESAEKNGFCRKIKFVGSDLFTESADFLNRQVLTAIIDKKISHQSYTAFGVLFDYVVKGKYPPKDVIFISPEVVLRSNAVVESGD